MIHRDVKPSNILVRQDGTAVLSDFGLAREEGLPSLTLTGDFAGTPYYVSPEQAMARRMKVDHRTDVYSLGVTLYELLALRRPFEGSASQEVLGKIITKEPPNPKRFNPLLPRDLVTIVLKAIEKDPDRRYASAAAFAADLRALLSFRPIAARPQTPVARILKFASRHRAASVAAVAATLGLSGTGAAWWFSLPGYLNVTSPTHGALVFVDGQLRGATPLERLALPPGPHLVRLTKQEEDLQSPEEELILARGFSRHLDRSLSSNLGVLLLDSDPPGATVTLLSDDAPETTVVPQPTPTTFTVRAGRYQLRFEEPWSEPLHATVEVRPAGATTRLMQVLQPKRILGDLPPDFVVHAVGIYAGAISLPGSLGDSGNAVTQAEVVVNAPGKPVLLVLMAHDPVVWRIGRTKATTIAAILVSGYHPQGLIGIDRGTPYAISTYEKPGPFPWFYVYAPGPSVLALNDAIERVTGKQIARFHNEQTNGIVFVGGRPNDEGEISYSSDLRTEDWLAAEGPSPGPAGLDSLVKDGLLRLATAGDIDAWVEKASEKERDRYGRWFPNLRVRRMMLVGRTYVVLGRLRLPNGLFGAHSREFIVPEGMPFPEGELGHSRFYLMDGTTKGVPLGDADEGSLSWNAPARSR